MFDHAAVELVGQQIDGGVHVFLGGVGVDRVAANMQGGFGLLSKFLNGQYTVHIDDVVEMTRNAFELLSGEGIAVARRTVAKYREALGLAPSNERKAKAAAR